VVFHSFASNLVAGDTNNAPDVFAHDLTTGTTTRVSVSSSGTQGTQQSVGAQISGDGRFVAFDSDAPNLVAGDLNGRTDVFVHDRVSGVTERASVSSLGAEGNNRSGFVDPPSLSFDGRYVAFTSGASNLVPDDTNNRVDVMVRDRTLATTVRVNVAADGTEADGSSSLWANVSADGSVVVYASSATNLVPDDLNFVSDVFAWIDTCGNGTLDLGESCDDGNRADGDCCSAACVLEPAGQACDDGDLCTQGDACDGDGSCGGGDPVVCGDGGSGECGSPAVCDPASGACIAGDPAPVGTACDDGDLCTQSDACDGDGGCVGGDPVVCGGGGSGQCGSPGACDPATGACVGGPAPDGSACDDGDPCTVDDACSAGVCAPGDLEPAACLASFQCYGAFSWTRPVWWYGAPKIRVEDRFESATFQLGAITGVCSALSSPAGQNATRLACVSTRRTSGSDRSRTVDVANALGGQTLKIGKTRELCLPAGKSSVPSDPGLDAFKCYSAETKSKTPRFRQVTVRLSDEFGSGTVDVVAPEMLCNPASVAGSDVLHVDAHLVCYRIEERRVRGWPRDVFRPRNVTITSAAGKDTAALLWREQLCVPSIVTTD
jgi:cysteine-rich repeat protein